MKKQNACKRKIFECNEIQKTSKLDKCNSTSQCLNQLVYCSQKIGSKMFTKEEQSRCNEMKEILDNRKFSFECTLQKCNSSVVNRMT